MFAGEGLRTLCLAYKDLDEADFAEWSRRHHEASTAMDEREEKLSAVYEEIEKDMKVWSFLVIVHNESTQEEKAISAILPTLSQQQIKLIY